MLERLAKHTQARVVYGPLALEHGFLIFASSMDSAQAGFERACRVSTIDPKRQG